MDSVAFRTTCLQNGLQLSDEQIRLIEEYSARLMEWNKKVNVVSRRDEDNFWERHILHCVSLVFKVELPEGAKVVDLGTGGGLPGVVLKIVRPDLSFTLLDSTQKKINVVTDVVDSLGLAGIETVWGRAEDLGVQGKYKGQYDIVVARAVAPLKDLARWAYPFLKRNTGPPGAGSEREPGSAKRKIIGSALVAFKGGDLNGEIRQLQGHPNVSRISTIELTLQGSAQLDDRDKKIVVVDFV